MKHTELPWIKDSDEFDPAATHIMSESGQPIIWSSGFSEKYGDREANAAFIVKACNEHYILLEALKCLYSAASWIDDTSGVDDALRKARKAIKQTEAK